MRLGFIRDENGKLVRKWVREGEEHNPEFLFRVGAEFCDYIWTDEDHIEEAKEGMLEQMFDAIRCLSKLDEFWVVKGPDYWEQFSHPDNMVDPIPQQVRDGKISIAWMVEFPQMVGYYHFEESEQIQKRFDECISK